MTKTVKLNKKIAEALEMELPPEEEIKTLPVRVEPTELPVPLNNPDLPSMVDIDVRLLEGEKQLEELIQKASAMLMDQYEQVSEIEPQYRNRHMEIASMFMSTIVDAVKHKNELQMKKKEQRMKEAKFSTETVESGPKTINAAFFGTREDLRKMLKEDPKDGDSE